KVLHPPVSVRPATRPLPQPVRHDAAAAASVGRSWFDEVPEEDGPTHECQRCHRQVLDSARFCRSCGHRQD
ncbi:MAG TPA: zinc ribbon domain-containing protein, partial [Candidatus Limnocylindrales bacterium]|nr:zinc ribbon domain-containing protein [Candidatus Limnocylindrales bacterium]